MDTSLNATDLCGFVTRQLNHFFPDGRSVSVSEIRPALADTLERIEFCFRRIRVDRYCTNTGPRFDHLYSDQYLMFLWFLANTLWQRHSDVGVLNKLYLLNKALHAFDCSYSTGLPDVFVIIHGVGTVLGKAVYADFMVVYHGCTVGQAHGKYPVFGKGAGLGTGASVLGGCIVGNLVSVGAGCTLVNKNVESGTSVYRNTAGVLTMKKAGAEPICSEYFLPQFLSTIE